MAHCQELTSGEKAFGGTWIESQDWPRCRSNKRGTGGLFAALPATNASNQHGRRVWLWLVWAQITIERLRGLLAVGSLWSTRRCEHGVKRETLQGQTNRWPQSPGSLGEVGTRAIRHSITFQRAHCALQRCRRWACYNNRRRW